MPWSPPGRSVRPTDRWKSTSPEKIACSSGIEKVTCPGLWPGREEHVDLEAGQLEPLAAVERVLGVVGLERAEARPGDEAH